MHALEVGVGAQKAAVHAAEQVKRFDVGDWVLVQTDGYEYVTKVKEVFWQEDRQRYWYNYGDGMSGSVGHNLTKMVKCDV